MVLKDSLLYGRIQHPFLGPITICRDGRIISRRTTRPTTSWAQYLNAARVSNASALWRALKEHLTMYLELNISFHKIFTDAAADKEHFYGLPTELRNSDYCTVAPILVSHGTLNPILYDPHLDATNISLGNTVITEMTTEEEFSEAIMRNNPDFQYGDILVLLQVDQCWDAQGNPYVDPYFSSFQFLRPDDPEYPNTNTGLLEFVSSVSTAQGNRLTYAKNLHNCAFAFIHFATRSDKAVCSTQHLICRYDPWPDMLPLLEFDYHNSLKRKKNQKRKQNY